MHVYIPFSRVAHCVYVHDIRPRPRHPLSSPLLSSPLLALSLSLSPRPRARCWVSSPPPPPPPCPGPSAASDRRPRRARTDARDSQGVHPEYEDSEVEPEHEASATVSVSSYEAPNMKFRKVCAEISAKSRFRISPKSRRILGTCIHGVRILGARRLGVACVGARGEGAGRRGAGVT
jgi:hypothetical protein